MSDWPPPPVRDPEAFEKPQSRPRAWDTAEFWFGALAASLVMWLGNLLWGVLT